MARRARRREASKARREAVMSEKRALKAAVRRGTTTKSREHKAVACVAWAGA